MLCTGNMFGQVKVIHFNADWNSSNSVKWIKDLSDCKISSIDIVENAKLTDFTAAPEWADWDNKTFNSSGNNKAYYHTRLQKQALRPRVLCGK